MKQFENYIFCIFYAEGAKRVNSNIIGIKNNYAFRNLDVFLDLLAICIAEKLECYGGASLSEGVAKQR